jgi:hypothetical protein
MITVNAEAGKVSAASKCHNLMKNEGETKTATGILTKVFPVKATAVHGQVLYLLELIHNISILSLT